MLLTSWEGEEHEQGRRRPQVEELGVCQGSELGLLGMGAGTNLSHGPGQDRGGLQPPD